jgi:YD repeat-containing protein
MTRTGGKTAMTDATGSSSYVWDPFGELTSDLNGAGKTITTSYDNTDTQSVIALKNVTSTLQSFTYSDAPAGNVTSETDTPSSPKSPAAYTYDPQGRVTSMRLATRLGDHRVSHPGIHLEHLGHADGLGERLHLRPWRHARGTGEPGLRHHHVLDHRPARLGPRHRELRRRPHRDHGLRRLGNPQTTGGRTATTPFGY